MGQNKTFTFSLQGLHDHVISSHNNKGKMQHDLKLHMDKFSFSFLCIRNAS